MLTALSDKHIFGLLKSRKLIIHPLLSRKQISGGRIDLRLDNVFYIIRRFEKPVYDPTDYIGPETPKPYGETYVIPYGDRFFLHPGMYVLAPLFEFVEIPKNILGRLDGRSSLGRLGVLVHSTAGSVDPGYRGSLVIELMNGGMFPIALYPLMRVATLALIQLSSDAKYPYEGKYGGIDDFPGAESRLHKDKELPTILEMKRAT